MKKKTFIISGLVVAAILGTAWLMGLGKSDITVENNLPTVEVTQGTIVSRALATGTIQPQNEVQVKSKISGVVSSLYVQPGSYVKEGEPLLEIRPDPTPLELAEAKRNLELTSVSLENIQRELARSQSLLDRNLISAQEFEAIKQRYDDAVIRHQLNSERLELLESGRVNIGGSLIESVIRAPISGFVLERMVEIGDPIVPLTTYQAGTPLMVLAEMDNLIFKGTVDEIDVGKISEGMPTEIKIGALPDTRVYGTLKMISLKSQKQDNSTVFPIEILITETQGATLRAGYSANADIIIERREDVLLIPERVVTYRDDSAFIEIPGSAPGSRVETEIKTGLSDAIRVEVKDGLKKGDKVLEKPLQRLTVQM